MAPLRLSTSRTKRRSIRRRRGGMRRFGDAVPAPACRPDAEPPRSRNASAVSLAPWRPLRSTPVGVLLGAGPADAAAQCVRRPGSRESESVCPAAVCRIRPLQPETAPGMYARRITCKQTANDRHHGHTLKAIENGQSPGECLPPKALEDTIQYTESAHCPAMREVQ